jgi:transcription antitermination factor NusA-like protein
LNSGVGAIILKYPLDRICIKSGVYCPHCQQKIEGGIVDRSELDVLRTLVTLEDKLKFLKKGEYVRSVQLSNDIYVFVKDGFEPAELSTLEHELSRELGKRVRVIEYVPDSRRLIEQIFYPAQIAGINRVWLPDGSEILNIRISRRDRKWIEPNKDQYERLIEKIIGIKTRITFDHYG